MWELVWELVADLETWPTWAPVRSAELDPLSWARPTAGVTSTPDGTRSRTSPAV
jgi:hypothetical protein